MSGRDVAITAATAVVFGLVLGIVVAGLWRVLTWVAP